ncbi:hypothetical protein pipiens_003097 [Culex pipiens pipiens]|uniref:Uncharacterized protein n=1 Tax=Culex pipiens pipiens TaxID=38569 RepID=A0ABD1D6M7_CULPP
MVRRETPAADLAQTGVTPAAIGTITHTTKRSCCWFSGTRPRLTAQQRGNIAFNYRANHATGPVYHGLLLMCYQHSRFLLRQLVTYQNLH